jgi:SAM-dependent methyltransferase
VARFIDGAVAEPDYHRQLADPRYLEALEPTRLRQAKDILRALREELGSAGHLLDYGCGRGFFLQIAQAEGAAPLAGADPSPTAVEVVKALGVAAVPIRDPARPRAVAETVPFRPRVLTLLDVLEHVEPDRLGDWLAELVDAFRPELAGVLIKVPISSGLMYRSAAALARVGMAAPLDQLYQVGTSPPHLNYFSFRSMHALLDRLRLPVARSWQDPEFEASALRHRAGFLRRVPRPVATAVGAAAVGMGKALRMQDTAVFLCRAR